MINNNVRQTQIIYYHDTTTNQSFMDMYYYLKAKGVKNNKFHLSIRDPDLMGVDPRDPKLSLQMKAKVFIECRVNYWYFIREVVRIPEEGGNIDSGTRYKLHRGNLAMSFFFSLNYNMFVELPRQHGKTTAAVAWYLWVFNFATTNTKMMFINKKHDDARKNLKDLKRLRSMLPNYLQMDSPLDNTGKKIRVPNTVDTLQNPINYNLILTLPAAPSKAKADGAGRGATMAIHYYDEFGFILHNQIIWNAAYPAFSRASVNAAKNNAPYGILITTTPGDMTTEEGRFANQIRLAATPFSETFYDKSYAELEEIRKSNKNSIFFHIRFTYQQLGSGEDYFAEQVSGLNKDWPTIRREVLLEWSSIATNCPFSQEDLNVIETMLMREPIQTLFFGPAGQYQLHLWSKMPMNSMYPPIIGVDVSNGFGQDSSAITIIDSETTKVLATFNCNYIPHQDLAQMIFDIVTKYMPRAIINIERNGGFGASVLQLLIKSKIKDRIYYEIKERVVQERYDGVKTIHRKQNMKIYGTDNTSASRKLIIELLHQRVQNHKDKFLAPILFDEIRSMETKKNGRVEHSSTSHDDQVFSYLWALYVWYYGENLMERFHMMKTEIQTDQMEDETQFTLEERYGGLEKVPKEIYEDQSSPVNQIIEESMQSMKMNKISRYSSEQYDNIVKTIDDKALDDLLQDPLSRKAYADKYNLDLDYINSMYQDQMPRDISDDILKGFYNDGELDDQLNSMYQGNLHDIFKTLS